MKKLGDFREQFDEMNLDEAFQPDPPPILVLKRKAIRVFSGGEKVALYHNEHLGIEVSVPYKPGEFGKGKNTATAVAEDYLGEAAIHKIHHIARSKTSADVAFKNGTSSAVDHKTAINIMRLHGMLKPENKSKIENLVNTSPEGLKKVAEFIAQNLK